MGARFGFGFLSPAHFSDEFYAGLPNVKIRRIDFGEIVNRTLLKVLFHMNSELIRGKNVLFSGTGQ